MPSGNEQDNFGLAPDDRTRDAVHTIVSGRKSWKTLKGKGEAVWPPYLEAALVEALDRYRPETSRSARSLSRFPNRNRFISDYIFHVTGKRRTAKQVGSRLQQLRDTCGGKRILKLLSNRDFSSLDDPSEVSSPSHDGSDRTTASNLTANGSIQNIIKPSRALVHMDVLPANAYWCPSPSSNYSNALSGVIGSGGIVTPPLSPAVSSGLHPSHNSHRNPASGAVSVFKSSKARPLRAIDPTVTFTSATYMEARSSCSVYFNGNCIHTESADMRCQNAHDTMAYMYSTTLVPQFWAKLCESNEPSRYSIVQEIIQASNGINSEHVLLTVVYQLTEPSGSPSPSLGHGRHSPALSSASSSPSGGSGSRSSSGSVASPGHAHSVVPSMSMGRNSAFDLLPCNTSSFMNPLHTAPHGNPNASGSLTDLPITPVSDTFSTHSNHSGSSHPHLHRPSPPHHSSSHTHSYGLSAAGGPGDHDAYFSAPLGTGFDDLTSFGTLPTDYPGLGVSMGATQWTGGYSPGSSFE